MGILCFQLESHPAHVGMSHMVCLQAARERLEAIQSAQRANYNAGQQLQDLINGGGNKPGFGWPLWR